MRWRGRASMGGIAVLSCQNCPHSNLLLPIRHSALHKHHYHRRNPQQWRPCWTLKKRNNDNRLSMRGAWRCSAGGGNGIGNGDVEWEGGNAGLEQRVFDFMQSSEKPTDFPTKDELLKAGHSDLVNAIIAHGGWLASGWDVEELSHSNSANDDEEECIALEEEEEDCEDGEFQKPSFQNPIDVSAEELGELPVDIGNEDESGIAGMLSRLERERSRFYSDVSTGEKRRKKSTHGTEPWSGVHDLRLSSVNGKRKADDRIVGSKDSEGTLRSLGRDAAQTEYENADLDFGDSFIKLRGWERPIFERMEDKEVETKGEQGFSRVFWQRSRRTGQNISSQTMHIDDKANVVVDKIDGTTDKRPEWRLDVKRSYSGDSEKIYSRDAPKTITSRIQNLEFQLSSTLGLLRSGKDATDVNKVFALRNLHSNYSLMEEDKREDVEAKDRELTEDDMNEKGTQSETSMSSVLDLSLEQSSRQPFTARSQEDSDLALARALQEQERAYMLLRRNAESSDYETSGSGNYDHEYYIDDSGENEDEVDANADEFEGEEFADGDHEEVDASLFETDEAYARALQEAEDRLLTAQMMALAGINDREEDDNEDDDSTSRDAWQDVDPDNMLYEELVALSEVVGTQSRGLAPDLISSLPLSKYVPESPSSINSEKCVICHLEYEGGDIILTLPCKHQYHSDCIKNWLQINKVCPVCSVEVSDRTNH